MKFEPFVLPKELKLGSSTAALQVEGGDINSNWYRWCDLGNIKDGSHCKTASDHWNRVDEDIELMKAMNHQVYRMGLSWSKIEPEQGKFDDEVIAHYRDEISKLKSAGIEPLVTLHHFTNPLWFEDKGGFTKKGSVDDFMPYVEYVVRALGDWVSEWIPVNEPNVYLSFSYLFGDWPPGNISMGDYFKGSKNLGLAHCLCYEKIHTIRKEMGFDDTKVGTAFHQRVYHPKRDRFADRLPCNILRWLFENIHIKAAVEGKKSFPLGFGGRFGQKGKHVDFIGVNYYTRDIVSFTWNLGEGFGKREVKEGADTNDLGWEIYPEGLYEVGMDLWARYGIPMYITENGISDPDDKKRPAYLYSHLREVKNLIEDGVDLRRYYHWSTMDNFEWIEGLTSRFGLVHVDYESGKRTMNQSGKFYGEIAASKSVTDAMIKKYL